VVDGHDEVCAHNIETKPTFAPQPREVTGDDGTTATKIVIEWDEVYLSRVYPVANIVETGNSWITSYVVEWDAGTGDPDSSVAQTWYALAGHDADPYMALTYTHIDADTIVAGTTYAFRLALINRHGQS